MLEGRDWTTTLFEKNLNVSVVSDWFVSQAGLQKRFRCRERLVACPFKTCHSIDGQWVDGVDWEKFSSSLSLFPFFCTFSVAPPDPGRSPPGIPVPSPFPPFLASTLFASLSLPLTFMFFYLFSFSLPSNTKAVQSTPASPGTILKNNIQVKRDASLELLLSSWWIPFLF